VYSTMRDTPKKAGNLWETGAFELERVVPYARIMRAVQLGSGREGS
jgi:hypothetical protein